MPKKITYDFVKTEFEKEGYTLISTNYVSAFNKLHFICPKGHSYKMQWCSWQQGKRCRVCSGRMRLTIKFVNSSFKKEGYNLLTKRYKNNRQKLNYICSKGHKSSITWADWQRGRRCVFCSNEKRFEKMRLPYSFIKKQIEKNGYKLLSTTYNNNRDKLDYICPKGHQGSIRWHDFSSGHGCPECWAVKQSGPGNCNWKGGITCEPYCSAWLDKEYKESIKKRDGHTCLNPNCYNTSKRLCIHHINYGKKDCAPTNLITLCYSCNAGANKDREWHTAWYQAIMYRRYGYQYNNKKECMQNESI